MQTDKQTDFANQGDTISRQAAIDALTHKWDGMVTSVFDVINSLPPALPDFDEWCTDCKEYDKERNSCPRRNRVIRETLRDMKGARQEIIRCKDCKYSEH